MTSRTKKITYIGISIALISICSWISIPLPVPFTLQTFAVFLVLKLLGGKQGTLAILGYILLGAVGIPVFAGFTAGFGVLFGTTGGYLLGFVLTGAVMWACEKAFGKSTKVFYISAFIGLAFCYIFGSVWFMLLYMKNTGPIGLVSVMGWCVFPFVIPDIIKLCLAEFLGKRISKAISS